jgi:hypothetical protein
LKEGIDRRSRLMSSILGKYLSREQLDDYEYFLRMKSTLVMDNKDIEDELERLEKKHDTPALNTFAIETLPIDHMLTVSTTA